MGCLEEFLVYCYRPSRCNKLYMSIPRLVEQCVPMDRLQDSALDLNTHGEVSTGIEPS